MSERLAKKVLLIGWDAADWKVINPLMDAGLMPTLNGLVNPDTASVARFPLHTAMRIVVDDFDQLYVTKDSATLVYILDGASTLSGDIAASPRTIHEVGNSFYGIDYVSY